MIRDRIICGISDDKLHGWLSRKGGTTLHEVALQCRAHEASEEQMTEFCAVKTSLNVQSVKSKKKSEYHSSIPGNISQRTCKFSGFKHVFGRIHCLASNKQCMKCGRTGHLKRRCDNFQQSWKRQV